MLPGILSIMPSFPDIISENKSILSFLKGTTEPYPAAAPLGFSTLGTVMSIVLGVLLSVTYISTWRSFISQILSEESNKLPPVIPYMLPYIGSAISFVENPAKFFRKAT